MIDKLANGTDIRSWITPGAKDAAASTYASIKTALESYTGLKEIDYEVFLQGSYANATNTRGDSDVDIVVMLKSSFIPDISNLSPAEKIRHEINKIPPSIYAPEFRQLVENALALRYGNSHVHPKDKCIRVDKTSGYVDADVVPALQYRRFKSYPQRGLPEYIEGISIHPSSGGNIVNFPKIHLKNGQHKNLLCLDRYKKTVRQLKRLRRACVNAGLFDKRDAPGYLLECLVYNVPNEHFVVDDIERFYRILVNLNSTSTSVMASEFYACDGIHKLFIDDPGRHDPHRTERVISAMRQAS